MLTQAAGVLTACSQSMLPAERREIVDAQRRIVRQRARDFLWLRLAVGTRMMSAERDARALRGSQASVARSE